MTIPSIYIAVPFNSGDFKGKVLYTSAFASNLNIEFEVGVDWKIDGVKYITPVLLEKMTNATQEPDYMNKIDELWYTLKEQKSIHFSEKKRSDSIKLVTIDGINEKYPLFPQTRIGNSDIAEDIIFPIGNASYNARAPATTSITPIAGSIFASVSLKFDPPASAILPIVKDRITRTVDKASADATRFPIGICERLTNAPAIVAIIPTETAREFMSTSPRASPACFMLSPKAKRTPPSDKAAVINAA